MDHFTSLRTAQLPHYNSWIYDPGTEPLGAMAQDWSQENNFINLPFKLIPQILDKLIAEEAIATIITPAWPAQPWFNKLLSMTIRTHIPLPNNHQTMLNIGVIPEPLQNNGC